jgi:drug/metabolite transporter (DMT)-like permease
MLAICLAVASSLGYGAGDFAGGLAARRTPVLRVVMVTLTVSLAFEVALLPAVGGRWPAAALLWGGAAGLASAAASALLYRSLALGPMSVLSPVTAVVSAALPVAAGLAAGERLTGAGACGVVLAVAAVVAVSTGTRTPAGPAARAGPGPAAGLAAGTGTGRRAGPGPAAAAGTGTGAAAPAGTGGGRPGLAALGLAVAAGAGIAAQLICLSRTPHDSGIAPLIACRAVSVAVLLPVAILRRGRPAAGPRPSGGAPSSGLPGGLLLRRPGLAVAAGLFDAAGNLAFLLAVRGGTLVVVAVITALYPAGTVLLARRVLGEGLTRWQLAGLGAAAVAVTILALS